jgi:hypothetical protein
VREKAQWQNCQCKVHHNIESMDFLDYVEYMKAAGMAAAPRDPAGMEMAARHWTNPHMPTTSASPARKRLIHTQDLASTSPLCEQPDHLQWLSPPRTQSPTDAGDAAENMESEYFPAVREYYTAATVLHQFIAPLRPVPRSLVSAVAGCCMCALTRDDVARTMREPSTTS